MKAPSLDLDGPERPAGTIYCEYSGMVREAFRKRGWNMWSCDLIPSEDNSPHHIQDDANSTLIASGLHDKFAGVHWPCTYFTNSSVRWMYGGKGRVIDPDRMRRMKTSAEGLVRLLQTLEVFKIPFYFENPVMHGIARDYIISRFSWFASAPMCTVQPWHFGTWETKRTCLWLHKLPALVPTYNTEEECRIALGLPEFVLNKDGVLVKNKPEAKCHKASPGPNRGHERSRTLATLANAMAEQWGGTP